MQNCMICAEDTTKCNCNEDTPIFVYSEKTVYKFNKHTIVKVLYYCNPCAIYVHKNNENNKISLDTVLPGTFCNVCKEILVGGIVK